MTKEQKKRVGRGGIEIEDLGDIELSPEMDADIEARTKRADEALAATTVNFRWQKLQLEMVKKVAAKMGIPYQTYIKMVVFRQAVADLEAITRSAREESYRPALRKSPSNWTQSSSPEPLVSEPTFEKNPEI